MSVTKNRKAALLGALAAGLLSGASHATTPAKPVITPVYGDINPFYGDIGAFWGDINPFYGDIGAFWGDINPFYGDIGAFWGDINPFYGDIGAFWGDINPFWTTLNQSWGNLAVGNPASLAALSDSLDDLISRSAAFWGASVEAKTGKSFMEGFAAPLLAKFGLNAANPASFAGKTAAQRGQFMLTWYDQLMEYAGVDHVDHWMRTINWTPALTQQQGSGYDAVIGLLDFTVAGDADVQNNLSFFSGTSTFSNGHGAGVASLMVAAHDGRGVMGIAPNASVVAYNPFDASGTTNFADVTTGITALVGQKAGVINMSLGVKGWTLHQGWRDVFAAPALSGALANTVFVLAAGNDGISQTQNVVWDFAVDPALLVVGSVDPNGVISSFSNRPGTACLVDAKGKCKAGGSLMNRFLVAPGELILVSDDAGGVTRKSGTSLAAPLVSGTIALLQDRWPWLVKFPEATAQIVLQSARDLGAPGVDPVYGWGLLDVEAAQSILDFNKLFFYEYTASTTTAPKKTVASQIQKAGFKASWEAAGAYFTVFEPVANAQRDFAIPLSSRLFGQTLASSGEMFQAFMYDRFVEWVMAKPCGKKCFRDTEAAFGLSDASVTVDDVYGMTLSFGYTTRQDEMFDDPRSEYALRLANAERGIALNAGYGRGAAMMGYRDTFALTSDYRAGKGATPLLGFASGGAYASFDYELGGGFALSAGMTESGDGIAPEALNVHGLPAEAGLVEAKSGAVTLDVTYRASESVVLRGSYTELAEEDSILGVQSLQDDFSSDTVTDGLTLGADVSLGDGYMLGLSATLGRTRASDNDLALVTPALSTAFEAALTKQNLFVEGDRGRLTVGQPLHVESGTMSYTQIGVIDRLTGELGPVTQTFDIATDYRVIDAELLYGAPILDGDGEVGAYLRGSFEVGSGGNANPDFATGFSLRLRF